MHMVFGSQVEKILKILNYWGRSAHRKVNYLSHVFEKQQYVENIFMMAFKIEELKSELEKQGQN